MRRVHGVGGMSGQKVSVGVADQAEVVRMANDAGRINKEGI